MNPTPEHSSTEKRLGRGMAILAWVSLLGLLTVIFGRWEEHQRNPNADLDAYVDGQIREVVLESNRRHHYVASGQINGANVVFLLDTGASDVVIPQGLPRERGLKPGAKSRARTANGIVEVYQTRIDSLRLGAIHLRQVRASINPGMDGDEILLGMSALKQVEFTQRGDRLTLRQLAH